MSHAKSLTIAGKEWMVLRRKKSILAYIIGIPLILSVLFSLVVKNSIVSPSGIVADYDVGLQSLTYFFVVFAAILPASIAAYSIVGEKVEKSLEPLLAAPVTDSEILLGKSLAAFAPPILATWAGAAIFMVSADVQTHDLLGFYYFPNWNAAIMLALLAPLAAIMSIELAVIASSRVSDVRGATQIAGLMFVPFMIIFIAAVDGTLTFSLSNLLIISAVILVIDTVLFFFSTSTFHREEILTKWK